MNPPRARGLAGNIGFVFLGDSSSTAGAGKTGLTNASAGLNVSVRREKSATMTAYTGANVGAISTLGTWAAPGAGKVNFKEVDATNTPGLYELHFEDSKFDASDTSRSLVGMVTATGVVPAPFEIPLTAVDVQDGVRMALSALANAAAGASGGLPTLDSSLRVLANVGAWNGHAVPAENINGVPKVDCVDFLGQAVVLDANNLIKVDAQDWAAAVVGALPANFSSLAIDGSGRVTVGGAVTIGTNNDKTGYALSAAGLDQIAVSDPGAPANVTTIPKMIVALWRRFFRKSTLTATQLKTFADDNATVNSTQTVSDDGTTQTQGAAS